MKPVIVEFGEEFLQLEDYQVERALQRAAIDAMDRSERFNSGFVISEEGKIRILKGADLIPYRQQALQNLAHINQKISELESAERHASPALNDRPSGQSSAK